MRASDSAPPLRSAGAGSSARSCTPSTKSRSASARALQLAREHHQPAGLGEAEQRGGAQRERLGVVR